MEQPKVTPANMPPRRLPLEVKPVEVEIPTQLDAPFMEHATSATQLPRTLEQQAEVSLKVRRALGGGDSHMFGRKPGNRGSYRYS